MRHNSGRATRHPHISISHLPTARTAPTARESHLGGHGLAVVGDHAGLVAVEGDARVVERLLRVPEAEVEICHAALEYTPEVARDQRPPDRCRGVGVVRTAG